MQLLLHFQFDDTLGFYPLRQTGGTVSPLNSPLSLQKKGARFGTNVPMITELGKSLSYRSKWLKPS